MNKLNIIGFYPERLNILLDLACSSLGFKQFNVLENMEAATPQHYVPSGEYEVTFYNCHEQEHSFVSRDDYAFGVIGTRSKELVYNFFREKIGMERHNFPDLVHPTCVISESASLDYGCQVENLVSVNVLAEIGFGATIKTKSYVGHHTRLGDYVTVNPGVIISGFVEVGSKTLIGSGAVIRDGIQIGQNCLIGMGSVVVKDIPDHSVAYGNPCKVVSTNP